MPNSLGQEFFTEKGLMIAPTPVIDRVKILWNLWPYYQAVSPQMLCWKNSDSSRKHETVKSCVLMSQMNYIQYLAYKLKKSNKLMMIVQAYWKI